MQLDDIVPWGRSLAEYQAMFHLSNQDLERRILGCGDGPASFNTELTEQGYTVTSIDPIYQFSAAEIRQQVQKNYDVIISQVKQNPDRYVWQHFRDADDLGQARLAAMERFLLDYERGQAAGRYLAMSLPDLAFSDQQFDLCLCSHFLFLYSEQRSLEFHQQAIAELLRIAKEVRIFPVIQLDCTVSPYLKPMMDQLGAQGYRTILQTVTYEFQKGGNQMLQILHNNAAARSANTDRSPFVKII
jgi:SAM-dependent methyltransferase